LPPLLAQPGSTPAVLVQFVLSVQVPAESVPLSVSPHEHWLVPLAIVRVMVNATLSVRALVRLIDQAELLTVQTLARALGVTAGVVESVLDVSVLSAVFAQPMTAIVNDIATKKLWILFLFICMKEASHAFIDFIVKKK
jgi:hypothetical protein